MAIGDQNLSLTLTDQNGNQLPIDDAMIEHRHGLSRVTVNAAFDKLSTPRDFSEFVLTDSKGNTARFDQFTMESNGSITISGTFDNSLTPGWGGYNPVDTSGVANPNNPWQNDPYEDLFKQVQITDWKLEEKVSLPEGMTVEQAEQILSTCVVCEEPAPGICPTCQEAVKEARKLMLARWLADFNEMRDDSA